MVFLGLVVAAIAFYFGIPNIQTEYVTYFQRESFFLVVFGTIAATMLSVSYQDFRALIKIFTQKVLTGFMDKKQIEPHIAVKVLVKISEESQRTNKQALTKYGKDVGDGFLTRGLDMMAAGLDKNFIDTVLHTDIDEVHRRHSRMIRLIRNMGTFAPMFGMTGTVMGVIQVLKNVTDIDNIVTGMSLALLTTLYGLILTSVIFVPLANRLKAFSTKEQLSKEIITKGILAIMDKEIPLKVEKYLSSYLASQHKATGE